MTEFRPGRFEILPLVIKNLLIINVLVYLSQVTLDAVKPQMMVDLFGLHHFQSAQFQPWQIVTHLFLHGSLMHLVGNMFGLWMFGSVLEGVWGPKKFLTFYFVCGIGAGLLQLLFLVHDYQPMLNQFAALQHHLSEQGLINFYQSNGLGPHSREVLQKYGSDLGNRESLIAVMTDVTEVKNEILRNPTIGASGAIFGVLAAFVYLFPDTYLYFYFFIPIKAKWAGLAYFGFEIYSGISNNAGDNIAHWAHIGGGLVGFLLVLTWNRKNRRNFY